VVDWLLCLLCAIAVHGAALPGVLPWPALPLCLLHRVVNDCGDDARILVDHVIPAGAGLGHWKGGGRVGSRGGGQLPCLPRSEEGASCQDMGYDRVGDLEVNWEKRGSRGRAKEGRRERGARCSLLQETYVGAGGFTFSGASARPAPSCRF
jgi:hypothetical protein